MLPKFIFNFYNNLIMLKYRHLFRPFTFRKIASLLLDSFMCLYVLFFRVVISTWKLQLFVGGIKSYLRYLSLFTCSGVQHILRWVFFFALFFFVLCIRCSRFFWNVSFWFPLRYSLTFIWQSITLLKNLCSCGYEIIPVSQNISLYDPAYDKMWYTPVTGLIYWEQMVLFVLFFFVLCCQYCQFLWVIQYYILPFGYSMTFTFWNKDDSIKENRYKVTHDEQRKQINTISYF